MPHRAAASRRARSTTPSWCARATACAATTAPRCASTPTPPRRGPQGVLRPHPRRAAQSEARADRHAHLRAGHARTAHRAVHEDRLARARSAVTKRARATHMQKIRKGDTVVVTTGKEKGKRGTVLRIFESGKVLIEGVNR